MQSEAKPMSKRFSMKELKSPDKFFKAMLGFINYLRSNVKAYLTFSIVVVVITLAYVLVNHINDKREQKAMASLYILDKQMKSMDSVEPGDYIKLIETKLDELGSTRAGAEAKYMLAELYYKKLDWNNSAKYYEQVVNEASGLLNDLSVMGLAYSLENKGSVKEALERFEYLKDHTPDVYKAVALLGIGRCYKKLGEKDKALAAYESVIVSYPDTDYARMASVLKAEI